MRNVEDLERQDWRPAVSEWAEHGLKTAGQGSYWWCTVTGPGSGRVVEAWWVGVLGLEPQMSCRSSFSRHLRVEL